MRSQGWSFNKLSVELNVSKPTLIQWSRRHQFEIQNLPRGEGTFTNVYRKFGRSLIPRFSLVVRAKNLKATRRIRMTRNRRMSLLLLGGEKAKENYGRDHHPRCFTMWMAGGGSRPGTLYGETDEFSYNIIKDPVHIHEFHATVLRLLGMDNERFTFRYQGLDQRLTGVEPARVIKELIA